MGITLVRSNRSFYNKIGKVFVYLFLQKNQTEPFPIHFLWQWLFQIHV